MSGESVHILLFRGVGGTTQLPTKPLRAALEAAGFAKVATWINSGNAVLRSALPREAVIAKVAEICRRDFGFDKAIFAPTLPEWEGMIARNPFPEAAATPNRLHLAVLAAAPDPARVEALRALATAGERLVVRDGAAYLHTPGGFGASKLAARFDRGIGVAHTARNWNTATRLAALARAAALG